MDREFEVITVDIIIRLNEFEITKFWSSISTKEVKIQKYRNTQSTLGIFDVLNKL
jgi:hypothetical protein